MELSGVEGTLGESVRRTDAFQDVVTTGSEAIFVGKGGVVVEMPLGGGAAQRTVVGGGDIGEDLIDVEVCSNDEVYALDLTGGVWSREAAGSWSLSQIETYETVQSIACAPDNSLWVSASFATLISSHDGGSSWEETSFDDDLILTSVSFPQGDVGVAVGEFNAVVRSEDGGASWENLGTGPDEVYPLAAYFDTAQTGWIAGLGGEIYITRDGGLSWELEPTATEAPLYRIARIGGDLYAVGNFGEVQRREGGAWVKGDLGVGSFGYLRALAGANGETFIGGQSMAVRVSDAPAS